MTSTLETLIRTEVPNMDGWTTVERCIELAEFVLYEGRHLFVDIGCYGGRVALTAALAMRERGHGKVVAIDPWWGEACAEGESKVNADWWKGVPLEDIHQKFMGHLRRFQLCEWCIPIRATSQDASFLFNVSEIGMLNIDGGHSEAVSLRDAQLYVPHVSKGGIIFADDLDWTVDGVNSTLKMKEYIDSCAERIGGDSHFGIWRKK